MQCSWITKKMRWKSGISSQVLLACVLLVVGSSLAVGLQVEMEHSRTVQMIHAENDNLAKVFAEHIGLSVAGIDERLIFLKEEVESKGDPAHSLRRVFARAATKKMGMHLVIADAAGNLIGSTLDFQSGDRVAEREYFNAHRQADSKQIYIGKPVVDKISAEVSIPFSRRINNPDGSFGGIVAGLITMDYFTNFYRNMEYVEAKNVAVAGLDGIVRLQINRDPGTVSIIDIGRERLLQLLQQQTAKVFNTEYLSGEERKFVSFRRLQDHPLFLVLETSGEQRMASFYRHRNWYFMVLACFNLVVVWGGSQLAGKINRLVQTKKQLAASEEKYRTIIGSINDGVYVLDAATGKVVDVNPKGCDFYGLSRAELTAFSIDDMKNGQAPYSPAEAKQLFLRAAAGETVCFDWKITHKDGCSTWVEFIGKRMRIGNANQIVAVARDISQHKAQEAQIRQIAYSDSLTGLPNRAFLKEILNIELIKAQRGEAAGAVLFIDMDGLKLVNDHFGHSWGDYVIKTAGESIADLVGNKAVIARIGGDEFVVVLPWQGDKAQVSRLTAEMIKKLSRDYCICDANIYMSASIGVALYPRNASTVEGILKKADLAMYTAKSAGGNTWRFYDDAMEKELQEKLLLKHGLRSAIEKGELSLHYQPLAPTEAERCLSFEALLRWNSNTFGSVPPGRFIPLAEESETILTIGAWVLQEAVRFIRKLEDSGNCTVRVWVNVSPRQLVVENFARTVQSCIENAGIRPGQLGIEITENALIASLSDSTATLNALRSIGVRLAIDDFGTGYSSLTYLRNLPVHEIKIDKSFIQTIAHDNTQLRFVQCIIDLAHVLNLSIVAEGVENRVQLETLVKLKCDYIQGYILSHPLPEQEAIRFLNSYRPRSWRNSATG